MGTDEDRSPPYVTIDRMVASLQRNAAEVADYSFEGIRGLGNAVPMLVQNDGERLLELFVEPVGVDYWLRPGEAVFVTSYGHWDHYPFETIHESDHITVWCTSWFATVTDRHGEELPIGYQRPEGPS
ncbi:MAG: hypothetical protein ABIQ18_30460 [Umezawaea sp.]